MIIVGFGKKVLSTRSEICCTFYIRNASLLLWKQIESALENDIYFQSGSHAPKSHPNSAVVGVYEWSAVENHIKRSTRIGSVYETAKKDSIQFVVGWVCANIQR